MGLKKLLPMFTDFYPLLEAVIVEGEDFGTSFQLLSWRREKLQLLRRQWWPRDPLPRCIAGHFTAPLQRRRWASLANQLAKHPSSSQFWRLCEHRRKNRKY